MEMSKISISRTPTMISVRSPYNSRFVSLAKDLGGKFSSGLWSFDIRDEGRVLDLCRDVYGDDGTIADTCTIRVNLGRYAKTQGPIEVRGYPVARAFGRDSGAKLADGVVLLSGDFGSGGSVKNWHTASYSATVLIRDFPRHAAEEYMEKPPHAD
jgi:hypothetical protein